MLGSNFRYNDILASIAISQLSKVNNYIESHYTTSMSYLQESIH